MKKKKISYEIREASQAAELKDALVSYGTGEQPTIQTQIALSRREYAFLQSESLRRGKPIAGVIRDIIIEKMNAPVDPKRP